MTLRVNSLIGFGGGGALPIELSLTDSGTTTDNLTTYTFSAAALGAAVPSRVLFVAAWVGNVASITGITVGGNAGVEEVESLGTPADQASSTVIYRITTDPGGTTGDVVVTCADAGTRAAFAVIRVVNWENPATAFDTDTSDNVSLTVNIPAGGFAIAAAGSNGSLVTITGLTERWDFNIETNWYFAGAFDSQMAEETNRAMDFDGSDALMAVASFSK